MHLLLPLLASILLICGLLFFKRAGEAGCGAVTPLAITNAFSAIAFSTLWVLGGTMQPLSMLWQPAIVAILFNLGLAFTFMAVERGDVSIATPVLGVKVIFVAALLTLFVGQELPGVVWCAAVLAALGIAVIQWTGKADARSAVFTILFAVMAAASFASFDVLVQQWAPRWGTGRFLPIVFALVGVTSLAMMPWVDFRALRKPKLRMLVFAGAALFAAQAVCLVFTLAEFGDAARVNVVYTLRGLWGVALAWAAAKVWGGAEAELARGQLITRVAGAIMLTAAVILVIVWK